MVRLAGRCNDPRTRRLGKLDGEGADTAGTAVDQRRLTRTDIQATDDRLPGRATGQGNTSPSTWLRLAGLGATMPAEAIVYSA